MVKKQGNNQKNGKKPRTAIHLEVRSRVLVFHKIFVGTCYVVGILGIGLSLIFMVITLSTIPEKTAAHLVTASSNSVTLTWTAPGDDADTGRAASTYDIRYATFPITDDNWSSATEVPNPPTPKIADSSETFEVTGLEPDTLYYFAIKTVDEKPNWSGLSNVVSKKTAPPYVCTPNWSCTSWSICKLGNKARKCIDLNNCGTDEGKPVTRMKCEVPPEECEENWSCEDWSDCIDGKRTRQCTDSNNCGTEYDKPVTKIDCDETPPSPPSPPPPPPEVCQENWSCTAWSDCSRGYQRRECIDLNFCGTEENKPEEIIECAVGGAEPDDPQGHYLAVTPSAHGGPHLRLYDRNLELYSQFFTYAQEFRGGVNSSLGDVDGDGQLEIITGTGPGSAPHVRIFDTRGSLKYQFYAYPPYFRIGLSVATGDVDGNGIDEIIFAPQEYGGPHIRIFKYRSNLGNFTLFDQFFAYPEHFRMGVNLAAGDLNNDDLDEIIVAPRNRGGPHIRVFQRNTITRKFDLRFQFFAYAFAFRGGVTLTVGDVDNDGLNEIITGAGPGGGPHIRIFDYRGNLKYQFFAATSRFRGGVDVAAFDYDHDGGAEVVTGTYSQGLPGVKIFKWISGNQFEEKAFFYAYHPLYQWGIRVAGY